MGSQHLLAWALSCYASLDMLVMMYFCCNFNFLWCVWSVSSWPCCKFELSQIPNGEVNGFIALMVLNVEACLHPALWSVACRVALLVRTSYSGRFRFLPPLNFLKCKTFFLGFVFSWYIFTIFANKHLARKKNESRFVCSMLC